MRDSDAWITEIIDIVTKYKEGEISREETHLLLLCVLEEVYRVGNDNAGLPWYAKGFWKD